MVAYLLERSGAKAKMPKNSQIWRLLERRILKDRRNRKKRMEGRKWLSSTFYFADFLEMSIDLSSRSRSNFACLKYSCPAPTNKPIALPQIP